MQNLPLPSGDDLAAMVTTLLPRLLAAAFVLFVFWIAFRVTRRGLRGILERAGIDQTLIRMLVDNLYKATLLVLGIVMAASQLGVNIAAALAGLGVVGIAVGFAAQETVANMIAGFLIFWDRPFEVGHYITVQEQYGKVAEITMRTTRIRTQENTYVVLPNTQVIGGLLVNHSMYGRTRVNVPIGIAYKEQIAEARRVLLAAGAAVAGVMADPPPDVVATGLGASSVDLNLRVWIDDAKDERPVFYSVMEAAKVALDQAGIEIPFPHLQLFVDDVRKPVWDGAAALLGHRSA